MNESATTSANERRLLSFEVGGARYALPISGVIEVAEFGSLACIPTLPVKIGGVINHRGDALPVVRHGSLLDVERESSSDPTHVLVVTDRPTGGMRLGLPVDRGIEREQVRAACHAGDHFGDLTHVACFLLEFEDPCP